MAVTHIVAFEGSPRRTGNSSLMLQAFLEGVKESGEECAVDTIRAAEAAIKPCRGCLRCNLLKRCVIRDDDWHALRENIVAADVLLFATPIYFHHTTAPMKQILDRFRSFVEVRITEEGLEHRPHDPEVWKKNFFLFAALGSSSGEDARPLIELFEFMTAMLGDGNRFDSFVGKRLAVSGQITFSKEKLEKLYGKLGLPEDLAGEDFLTNHTLLERVRERGKELGRK